MIENDTTSVVQKTALIWSCRRERVISVRIYYDLQEQDGCKIYTLNHMQEI